MGYHHLPCLVLGLLLIFPTLSLSQDSFTPSRATFYGSPDCYGIPRGACGYGDYGRNVNDGYVTGVSKLYKDGFGCGSCYQVRCKGPLCTDDGAYVVVTDYGEGDGTDFILSERAYAKMAKPEGVAELFACGVVNIEFRRVPCKYTSYNIIFKVHEHSKYPDYLAVVALYVGGQYNITAMEIWQEACKEWQPMRKVYGAVWDSQNPPRGPINLRFQVGGANGLNWVQPSDGIIPGDWKPGYAYDSHFQLN
ncbi:hypothetical protein MLD38_015487 [Melastoma candidum]|uniref:Uncharacterized protein n=1 Tax=Melastoma candidum TaxID=119954 RepID=A0ACB9RGF2_9MYRT|nr:hypothetical protein MLD38_015487 [Melastoma candidum]